MTDLNNEASKLNDAELEVVVGGMDCKTGEAVSKFYDAMANCMKSVGNTGLQIYYLGMSQGILQACG